MRGPAPRCSTISSGGWDSGPPIIAADVKAPMASLLSFPICGGGEAAKTHWAGLTVNNSGT